MHDSTEQVKPEISMVSAQEIAWITSSGANSEEQSMLNSFKEIECLISEKEALALFRICKLLPTNTKILEIGSYQGGSTLAIGHAIAKTNIGLYCLDVWSNFLSQSDLADIERDVISDDNRILSNFIKNTAFIGDNLRMLKGKASAFSDILSGTGFDLIFIDGDHSYESVRNDIKLAFSALKPGGFICGHDFHDGGLGVKRAVNELISGAPSIEIKGICKETTIWYCIVPSPQYEYALAEISDLMNDGNLSEALALAYKTYAEFKEVEVLNFISFIKDEINKQKQMVSEFDA